MFLLGIPDPPFDKPAKLGRGPGVRLAGFSPIINDLGPGMAERNWESKAIAVGLDGAEIQGSWDVVVNCICEPAIHSQALERLDLEIANLGAPVVNPAAAVRQSGRVKAPRALAGQSGVYMPKTTFLTRIDPKTWANHLEEAGHAGAVLIRPLGTHGGKGLIRVDSPNEVPAAEPSPGGYLVSDFADTRSADGLYRKYRVVFAGGRLFHRHLIASDTWMVGPDSRRIMRERPALIAEEKAFMGGALAEMDERLASQFSRLGLDFGAADFAVPTPAK